MRGIAGLERGQAGSSRSGALALTIMAAPCGK
jgi:hypothetical protein